LIEQQGRVLALESGQVSVELGAASACSACDAGKGCGAGVLGRLFARKPVVLDLENSIGAKPGQGVVVGLPESLYLSLALRLYLYPLLAALAGATAGHALASHWQAGGFWIDFTALALALLAAAGVVIRVRRRHVEFPGTIAVHLLRTVECQTIKQ
jgi:sigma-E factor negative regulatory protein RseC